MGEGFVELAVVLEELGYACAATPLSTSATAAAVIQATGSPEQRARWLPQLSSGEATGAIGRRELAADADAAAVIVLGCRECRRYLSALKTLALVRKLAVPVLQVNIARKQVNVAGVSAAGVE